MTLTALPPQTSRYAREVIGDYAPAAVHTTVHKGHCFAMLGREILPIPRRITGEPGWFLAFDSRTRNRHFVKVGAAKSPANGETIVVAECDCIMWFLHGVCLHCEAALSIVEPRTDAIAAMGAVDAAAYASVLTAVTAVTAGRADSRRREDWDQ